LQNTSRFSRPAPQQRKRKGSSAEGGARYNEVQIKPPSEGPIQRSEYAKVCFFLTKF
uniref:Gag polyprotein n=1 Tax=Haemonchus placei TaxID=6290 RepID=A0A0N4WS04_HAEPC